MKLAIHSSTLRIPPVAGEAYPAMFALSAWDPDSLKWSTLVPGSVGVTITRYELDEQAWADGKHMCAGIIEGFVEGIDGANLPVRFDFSGPFLAKNFPI